MITSEGEVFSLLRFPHRNLALFEMSQATQSRSQQFTLGPIDPSTGKRTVVASNEITYKVQAYNLTQTTTPYVSGLVSAYSGAAAARGDDEDSSDDTDDQSEENDAAQVNAEDSEGEEADGSDSGTSDELSEDIARLEVEDGEGGESDTQIRDQEMQKIRMRKMMKLWPLTMMMMTMTMMIIQQCLHRS